jgi:hypothetical protein
MLYVLVTVILNHSLHIPQSIDVVSLNQTRDTITARCMLQIEVTHSCMHIPSMEQLCMHADDITHECCSTHLYLMGRHGHHAMPSRMIPLV